MELKDKKLNLTEEDANSLLLSSLDEIENYFTNLTNLLLSLGACINDRFKNRFLKLANQARMQRTDRERPAQHCI